LPKAPSPRLRVYFDIDGTLLRTDGAGRSALSAALLSVFGTTGPLDGYHFHGKTDPQIVLELMLAAGLPDGTVRAKLDSVWPVYLEVLERELDTRRRGGRIGPLPGVTELLAALEARDDVVLGLLTGNIEAGARLKLAAAGVRTAFAVGGYGSDSETRDGIARIAVERGGAAGDSAALVVVGDTPADVACARAVGASALAVATGRHTAAELKAAGADVVFADLRPTDRVLRYLLSLPGVARDAAEGAGEGGVR